MSRTKATCVSCGVEFSVSEMFSTACANRGKEKRIYMCYDCKNRNQGYRSQRTTESVGNVQNGFKYGIELETTGSTDYSRAMLYRFGFIATHDCSLNHTRAHNVNTYDTYSDSEKSCEYVSGLNYGLKRFTKQFIEIQKCFDERQLFKDSSCSCHCHISYNDMRDANGCSYMDIIRRNANFLFRPLQNVMLHNEEKTISFFGRTFHSHYAKQFDGSRVESYDRYYFINTTCTNNIEFRINYFQSAEQYLNLIKFESEIVKTVYEQFCEKYNQSNDTNALAKKVANKLAKKLQKIYDNM